MALVAPISAWTLTPAGQAEITGGVVSTLGVPPAGEINVTSLLNKFFTIIKLILYKGSKV